jgi:hypothetical protein
MPYASPAMSRGDDALRLDARYRPMGPAATIGTRLAVVLLLLGWVLWTVYLLGQDEPPLGVLCATVVSGLLLVAIGLAAVFYFRGGRRAAATTLGSNDDAIALLRLGRYDEAAASWERMIGSSRRTPWVHALYCANLGVAVLHRGELDRAVSLLGTALGGGWLRHASMRHLQPQLGVSLALAHALRGDLETAATERDAIAAAVGEPRRGLTLLVDTVLAVRRGELASADPSADDLRAAEANLMPSHVRAIRLLHAFARAIPDGSAYRTAAGGPAAALVPPDIRPGELDFLAARWPELRRFMEAHHLLAAG